MIKQKIFGFLNLIRFGVSLFGCIGLVISGVLAGDMVGFQVEYLLAFIIVLISASGAFAINDYYDFEVDKTNNREDRPLATGLISRRTAIITAMSSFIIVIFISFFLNLMAMILVLISLPIFYVYSMGLKKRLYVKNFLIAYSYLSTIFLGSVVIDSYIEPLIIFYAIMGFIVGLANEIMFDIADVKGDNEQGINTIPTRFGAKTAAKISILLYIAIVFLDPLPFFINIDQRLYLDYMFLMLILIPVIFYIILLRSLSKKQNRVNILKLRGMVFFIMQFGSISYLLGVLI
jgi:4-hydroxybenzoate polyprenyltransferase